MNEETNIRFSLHEPPVYKIFEVMCTCKQRAISVVNTRHSNGIYDLLTKPPRPLIYNVYNMKSFCYQK